MIYHDGQLSPFTTITLQFHLIITQLIIVSHIVRTYSALLLASNISDVIKRIS